MVYALHETLEVHEMAAFKTVCMTKSKTMQALISDPALKAILQQDVDISTRQLQELGAILAKATQQEMKA
jgi:similar to spore coat protein